MDQTISITVLSYLIEGSSYILTPIFLVHAWRHHPHLIFLIPASILYGFLVEHNAVTDQIIHSPFGPAEGTLSLAAYHYPTSHSIIVLPGPVPLNICLGWGTTIYAAYVIAKRLQTEWWIRPIIAAFLAIIVDFAVDPPFVALGLWTWTPSAPDAWFGIPWYNYMGWFFVVFSLIFVIEFLYRNFCQPKNLKCDAMIAFGAILPSLIMLQIMLIIYMHFSKGVEESTIHYLLLTTDIERSVATIHMALVTMITLTIFLLPVLYALPRMRRSAKIDWIILLSPILGYFWSISAFFTTELYRQHQALIIIIPLVIITGMLGYLWPSLDRILLRKPAPEPAPDEEAGERENPPAG